MQFVTKYTVLAVIEIGNCRNACSPGISATNRRTASVIICIFFEEICKTLGKISVSLFICFLIKDLHPFW